MLRLPEDSSSSTVKTEYTREAREIFEIKPFKIDFLINLKCAYFFHEKCLLRDRNFKIVTRNFPLGHDRERGRVKKSVISSPLSNQTRSAGSAFGGALTRSARSPASRVKRNNVLKFYTAVSWRQR